MSAFAELAVLPPLPIWDGVLGRALHGDRLTLSVVELEPDTSIPQHQHEQEQVGMLVVGSIRFRVDDEAREFRPGGMWCVAANTPHDVEAGSEGAVVIEAFSPCREDWRGLEEQEARPPRWPREDG